MSGWRRLEHPLHHWSDLKELLAKNPVKRQEQTPEVASEDKRPSDGEQEITTATKELHREVAELKRSVDTVEHCHDAQAEELDHQRQELLTLQESNRELQYCLEDLENR
ncbi:hypothetical protein NDU88_004720 [Pleurodeles waltl]|uniref:Uncharacterized protein n=1 Tax=Pleurodeles waltl TaxID=8319 RepID=A0AAV7VH13_PLEWA|nr:hypothetical protein NDU88_004720 [Pleurodeles waltl]